MYGVFVDSSLLYKIKEETRIANFVRASKYLRRFLFRCLLLLLRLTLRLTLRRFLLRLLLLLLLLRRLLLRLLDTPADIFPIINSNSYQQ